MVLNEYSAMQSEYFLHHCPTLYKCKIIQKNIGDLRHSDISNIWPASQYVAITITILIVCHTVLGLDAGRPPSMEPTVAQS